MPSNKNRTEGEKKYLLDGNQVTRWKPGHSMETKSLDVNQVTAIFEHGTDLDHFAVTKLEYFFPGVG